VGDHAAGLSVPKRSDRRVTRTRKGEFQIRLTQGERDILRSLPGQLRELLTTDDPALERLFPPAYQDDPAGNQEYEELMRPDLTAGHLTSIDVMEATIDAERLDEDQLMAWLGALNDLRPVLGTKLDVTEELYDEGLPEGDPRLPAFSLYVYLGWLQEQVVEALGSGLDPAGSERP
jgi:Domain of unknown function (DUF2017)